MNNSIGNWDIKTWIKDNQDKNLATCIMNIRRLDALSKNDVQDLHDFLWAKQRELLDYIKLE